MTFTNNTKAVRTLSLSNHLANGAKVSQDPELAIQALRKFAASQPSTMIGKKLALFSQHFAGMLAGAVQAAKENRHLESLIALCRIESSIDGAINGGADLRPILGLSFDGFYRQDLNPAVRATQKAPTRYVGAVIRWFSGLQYRLVTNTIEASVKESQAELSLCEGLVDGDEFASQLRTAHESAVAAAAKWEAIKAGQAVEGVSETDAGKIQHQLTKIAARLDDIAAKKAAPPAVEAPKAETAPVEAAPVEAKAEKITHNPFASLAGMKADMEAEEAARTAANAAAKPAKKRAAKKAV